jgi:hypothetical protein
MEGARDAWRGAARERVAGLGAARVADGWRMDPVAGRRAAWRAPDTGRTWCRGGDAGARAGPVC